MSWAHLGQIWGGWAAYVVHWRGPEIGWDPPRPQQVQTSCPFFSTFLHMCTLVQIPELSSWGRCFTNSHFAAAAKRDSRASETLVSRFRNVFPLPVLDRFNVYLNREAKYSDLWRSGAANGRFCVHNQASGTHACTGPSWGVDTIEMLFYWRRIGEP